LLFLLWKQNRDHFNTYQELIECLQITPRTKQSVQNNITHVLKYITWTLNVNISKQVLSSHILDIVEDRNTNTFPFTINIYTSYSFLKNANLQHIQNNFIGQYLNNDSKDILHILVTPDLNSNCIMINQLQLEKKPLPFNKHNLFANVHITEGDNVFKHTSSKETTLNQNFCICDHIETQRYISTRKNPALGIK